MALTAKNRLHASYVDRIAIVDRPCVPDAQIVLFKRKSGFMDKVIEKHGGMFFNRPEVAMTGMPNSCMPDMNETISHGIVNGVVNSLNSYLYNLVSNQDNTVNKSDAFKSDFPKFRDVASKIFKMAFTTLNKQDNSGDLYTTDDIISGLKEQLSKAIVINGINVFSSLLCEIARESDEIEDPNDTLTKVLDEFEAYMTESLKNLDSQETQKRLSDIQEDNATVNLEKSIEVIQKIGKKISSDRMAKIQNAMKILSDIIKEVTGEDIPTVLSADLKVDAESARKQKDAESAMQVQKNEQIEKSLNGIEVLSKSIAEMGNQIQKKLEGQNEMSEKTLKEIAEKYIPKSDMETYIKGYAGLETKVKDFEKHFSGIEELLEKHKKCILNLNSKYGTKKTSLEADIELDKGVTESNGEATFNDVVRGKKKI